MKETNSRNTVKRDQLISQQRKKLEQRTTQTIQRMRLQSQSQNTKLLKIQQKQRQVESEYQSKKKDMHETLSTLAQQAEQFLRDQDNTTKEFDSQKDQIYSNDRKIKMYEQQRKNTLERNEQKREIIRNKKTILEKNTLELNRLRSNISDYRIYHDFLRDLQQLSEEFTMGDTDEQGVNQIIKRYESLETKRTELIQQHHRIGQIKDEKIKRIQQLRSENSNKILTYTSHIKELKQRIDRLNEQNVSLESEIEGKLNENNERQTQIGQIIFSIRNLYDCIVGSDKPQRSILEMLETIGEEKKKLRDYMMLFQSYDQRRGK